MLSLQELTPRMVERLRRAGLRRWLPRAVLEPGGGAVGTGIYARIPVRARPPIQGTLGPEVVVAARWRGRASTSSRCTRRRRRATASRCGRVACASFRARSADRSRILAGDFNATLDHAELRDLLDSGYRDAADSVGAGLHTTWPLGRRWPPKVTIDHVLVDREWEIGDVRFVTLPGSDHRGMVAALGPATNAEG